MGYRFYYNDHNVYDEWDIGLLNLPLQSDTEANSPGDIKEHLEPPSSKQVDKFVAAVREKWYVGLKKLHVEEYIHIYMHGIINAPIALEKSCGL